MLILSPTRELAQQTEKVILAVGDFMNIQAHACVGGKSLGGYGAEGCVSWLSRHGSSWEQCREHGNTAVIAFWQIPARETGGAMRQRGPSDASFSARGSSQVRWRPRMRSSRLLFRQGLA